jgi:hypothetical protein
VSVASTTFNYHILAPREETFLTLSSVSVAYPALFSLLVTTENTALFIVSYSPMFCAKPTIHNYIVATRKFTFFLPGAMPYTHAPCPCQLVAARSNAHFTHSSFEG